MKTYEKWLHFPEVALAAPFILAHSLYQGWHSWRRICGVAFNFIMLTGGRDRLDRSVHFKGGPTLLARPDFIGARPGRTGCGQ